MLVYGDKVTVGCPVEDGTDHSACKQWNTQKYTHCSLKNISRAIIRVYCRTFCNVIGYSSRAGGSSSSLCL